MEFFCQDLLDLFTMLFGQDIIYFQGGNNSASATSAWAAIYVSEISNFWDSEARSPGSVQIETTPV